MSRSIKTGVCPGPLERCTLESEGSVRARTFAHCLKDSPVVAAVVADDCTVILKQANGDAWAIEDAMFRILEEGAEWGTTS